MNSKRVTVVTVPCKMWKDSLPPAGRDENLSCPATIPSGHPDFDEYRYDAVQNHGAENNSVAIKIHALTCRRSHHSLVLHRKPKTSPFILLPPVGTSREQKTAVSPVRSYTYK